MGIGEQSAETMKCRSYDSGEFARFLPMLPALTLKSGEQAFANSSESAPLSELRLSSSRNLRAAGPGEVRPR